MPAPSKRTIARMCSRTGRRAGEDDASGRPALRAARRRRPRSDRASPGPRSPSETLAARRRRGSAPKPVIRAGSRREERDAAARSAAGPAPGPRRPRGSPPATPSTRPEPSPGRRARRSDGRSPGSSRLPVACRARPGCRRPRRWPRRPRRSRPGRWTAVERIVWLIVSPVASAAAMIVVPSISPTTISAVRPRRRRTLRTPSLTRTRGCAARAARLPPTSAARARREDQRQRVDRDAEQLCSSSPPSLRRPGSSASTTS